MAVASNPISVRDLSKTYRIPVRDPGLSAALKSVVRRRTEEVEAVKEISFEVASGEIVGFLGPNGAGKTTTLKMMSGLLNPSAGAVSVLGAEPFKRERSFLRQITLVMGNRNQLVWDIPVSDSFECNRAIYRIPMAQFRETVEGLSQLLDLGELLQKPVRNLSLGHRPRILFLDEPTLGLDVTMQRRIRSFIGAYNKLYDATVLLTSHYMADVEALCERVLVIHHGQLLFDGALSALVEKFSPRKTIVVELDQEGLDLSSYGEVVDHDGTRVTLLVPKETAASLTGQLLSALPVIDLTVQEPPIEEVIEQVFAQEAE